MINFAPWRKKDSARNGDLQCGVVCGVRMGAITKSELTRLQKRIRRTGDLRIRERQPALAVGIPAEQHGLSGAVDSSFPAYFSALTSSGVESRHATNGTCRWGSVLGNGIQGRFRGPGLTGQTGPSTQTTTGLCASSRTAAVAGGDNSCSARSQAGVAPGLDVDLYRVRSKVDMQPNSTRHDAGSNPAGRSNIPGTLFARAISCGSTSTAARASCNATARAHTQPSLTHGAHRGACYRQRGGA